MKQRTIVCLAFFLLLPASLFAVAVTFKFTGLRSDQGVVWVGVYDNKKTYLKMEGRVTECLQNGKISQGEVDVVCILEPGIYAAAAYHDENENKKLDTNFLGLPKEGYGFPNDVKPSLGPPDFEEVLFTVGETDVEVKVLFQY